MRPLAPGPAAVALTAFALVAGLTLVATPASAVGETCLGVPATVAAAGVPRLDGTEGDDVIVAHDVSAVHALGGDDLVCVTGRVVALVDAGTGNDVVDATGRTGRTTTVLGDGDDTYRGSAAVDDVRGGATGRADTGRDVVDTGPAGADEDVVASGEAGSPNPDEVSGGWLTLAWAGTPTPTSRARAGRGSTFALDASRIARVRIDVPDRALTTSAAGPALALSGFTVFSLRAPRVLERLTFRGSNRAESLFVPAAGRAVVRATMRGGGDTVQVGTYARGSRLDGGRGRDLVDVRATARLDLDLGRGTLSKRSGRRVVTYGVRGFEDAFVRAPTARVVGTGGPNRISTDARGTVRLDGRAGDDVLRGSAGRDMLLGGPGRDRADGGPGRDVCRAEVRRSCEGRP